MARRRWRFIGDGGSFLGGMTTMMAGTVAAQTIGVIATGILARLYTPDEFGVFALYMVVLAVTSVVACLSYEPAVVLPKTDAVAARVLAVCIALAVTVGGIAAAVVAVTVSTDFVVPLRGLEQVLWWLPLNIALLGGYQALSYWATRLGLFGKLSMSRVGLSGTTALVQIVGGLAGSGVIALVVGQIAGQAAAVLMLAAGARTRILQILRLPVRRPARYIAVLRRYRKFPLYSTWGTLMNTAAFQIPQLILFRSFGLSAAGFYFLAYRLISMPMGLVGGALSQVLLQRVSSELRGRGDISLLVARVVGKSMQVWVPLFAVGAALAPWAFTLAFGAEWEPAGRYAQILAPLYLVQILASPTSVVMIALQRQQAVARIQGLLLLGAVTSLLAGQAAGGGALQVLLGYAICQGAIYVMYLGEILRLSATPWRTVAREAVDVRLFRRSTT